MEINFQKLHSLVINFSKAKTNICKCRYHSPIECLKQFCNV